MTNNDRAKGEIVNGLGMHFVSIQPGSFMMGSPEDEPARYDDEMLHEVTLSHGFEMQTTPVTVGQWRMFVEATGFETQAELEDGARGLLVGGRGDQEEEWEIDPAFSWKSPGFEQTDGHPITCLTLQDTESFIDWLNQQDSQGYRLPTEAEWEYVCRAGSNSIFTHGNCLSADDANFNDAIHPLPGCSNSGTYRKATVPVTRFRPNRWGLYDMHGNVMERCLDRVDFDEQTEQLICDTYVDGIVNPLNREGSLNIARGGCWSADAKHSRAACRIKYAPDERWTFLGFRLVRSVG